MPNDDLRSKLNAKVKDERDQRARALTERQKANETLSREAPRLIAELVTQIRALLEGTDQITIEIRDHQFIGDVTFTGSSVTISFQGYERIAFLPTFDSIAIKSPDTELSIKEIKMIPSRADQDRLILAVKSKSSPEYTELSEKILTKLLEDALL